MRFEFIAVMCGIATALPTFATDHDAEARAAIALAAATRKAAADTPPTYQDARDRAIRENKPLVVFVGDALCPGCASTLAEEDGMVCVATKTFEDVPTTGGIVLGVPDGSGDLNRVATITQWTTGDKTYGHVPSTRRALLAWRTDRRTQRSGWSPVAAQTPLMLPAFIPAQLAPQMTMMRPALSGGIMMGAGGCASGSCSSGGGAGRRR